MNLSKYNDPDWITEKIFDEQFDSSTLYYVVDIGDQYVLYSGSLQHCKKILEQNYAGLAIVNYSQLTEQMISSIKDPF